MIRITLTVGGWLVAGACVAAVWVEPITRSFTEGGHLVASAGIAAGAIAWTCLIWGVDWE